MRGANEQLHAECKTEMGTEMDMERLPSGKFKVNKALLRSRSVGMPAHNRLKAISRVMVMERSLGLKKSSLARDTGAGYAVIRPPL